MDAYEKVHGLTEQMATTATRTGWFKASQEAKTATRKRQQGFGKAAPPEPPKETLKLPKPETPRKRLVQKPPSPLGIYDYGKMSLRSVSLDALQPHHRHQIDKSLQTHPHFAAAPFGGYPYTMQETILMQPQLHARTPFEGVLDTAPLTRSFSQASLMDKLVPAKIPLVRSTRGADLRSRAHASALTKATMEQQLDDQVSWSGQRGYTWKERFDDYVSWLDEHGRKDDSAWLVAEPSEWTEDQRVTFTVLSEMHDVLLSRRMRVQNMFRFIEGNNNGTLEPMVFLKGLQRLGVPRAQTLTREELAHMIRSIDADFDGTISCSEISKAMQRVATIRKGL